MSFDSKCMAVQCPLSQTLLIADYKMEKNLNEESDKEEKIPKIAVETQQGFLNCIGRRC